MHNLDASRGECCEIGKCFCEAAVAEREPVGLKEGDRARAHRLLSKRGARFGLVLDRSDRFLCGVECNLRAGFEADNVVGAEEQVHAETNPVMELRSPAGSYDLLVVFT